MLEVMNVSKHFQKEDHTITALSDVSFRVDEGEIVGLLGPNGSGKTTLLNIIIGFYIPDEGDVKLFGESIFKNSKLINKYIRIPFLINDPRFSVYESLKLTAKFFGVKNYDQIINEYLDLFELRDDRNTQFQKLSLGNQRKVELIGALITNPKLLVLDEITNGLDLYTVNTLIDLLKKINLDKKISILFASHIFNHIELLCRRVIILHQGKILADDDIEKLKKKAKLKEYITIKTKSPLTREVISKISEIFNFIRVNDTTYKIVCDDASQELKSLSKFLYDNPEVDKYIVDISIKEIGLEDIFSYFVSKTKDE